MWRAKKIKKYQRKMGGKDKHIWRFHGLLQVFTSFFISFIHFALKRYRNQPTLLNTYISCSIYSCLDANFFLIFNFFLFVFIIQCKRYALLCSKPKKKKCNANDIIPFQLNEYSKWCNLILRILIFAMIAASNKNEERTKSWGTCNGLSSTGNDLGLTRNMKNFFFFVFYSLFYFIHVDA